MQGVKSNARLLGYRFLFCKTPPRLSISCGRLSPLKPFLPRSCKLHKAMGTDLNLRFFHRYGHFACILPIHLHYNTRLIACQEKYKQMFSRFIVSCGLNNMLFYGLLQTTHLWIVLILKYKQIRARYSRSYLLHRALFLVNMNRKSASITFYRLDS